VKQVTFTKLVAPNVKWLAVLSRPDYPGYLYEHPAHPGREFVLARTCNAVPGDPVRYTQTGMWHMYDRASGFALRMSDASSTRHGRIVKADAYLSSTSPETLAEKLEESHGRRLAKLCLIG